MNPLVAPAVSLAVDMVIKVADAREKAAAAAAIERANSYAADMEKISFAAIPEEPGPSGSDPEG